MKLFNVNEGFASAREANELGRAYGAVLLGVLAHFVWEILVGVLRTGADPEWGSWWVLVARIGVAVIVSAVSFVGVWKQLEAAEPKLRFFVALTQGFAIDALASPIAPATQLPPAGI